MPSDAQQAQQMSVNSSTYTAVFVNLQFNAQYSCCVDAVYTNPSENVSSCAVGTTEGMVPCAFNGNRPMQ